MILPTIHSNGTSRSHLIEVYTQAFNALREAIDAMLLTYPNMRDYYHQGADVFALAVREHNARIVPLIDARKEIEKILDAIVD